VTEALAVDQRIETCLDARAMQAVLQKTLPACASGALSIDSISISKVRRSSSRQRNPNPLTLCYELSLRDLASGRTSTETYYGKVYRDGTASDVANDIQVQCVPSLDLLLWRWPADPGLPQLPALLDLQQTCPWWGKAAEQVVALRHVPEDRATLRYSRRTSKGEEHLYAKTFCDGRASAVHERFRYFWTMSQLGAQFPVVAQPLAHHPETHTFWQSQAPGVPLVQIVGGSGEAGLPDRVAHALSLMHAAPLSLAGPLPRDRVHALTEVRRRQKKISRTVPELELRVARLADALEMASRQLPEPPIGLIHGDCHPEQFWVAHGQVVLFDFDEFALGDPMEDLAAFVTKVSLLSGGPAFATAMLAAYSRHAPTRFDGRRLHWHLAVQQLLQAGRAFVFQVPDWRSHIESRLSRAESLADQLLLECSP